ncbi:hypothetical protein G5I_10079 [Acromyrmex echinatior]|uniref:Uncharacterized protein n=1 Tax=Acromyrmex echinatior TaxID=103372 RepID=F4WVW9_ACREC|nr:hypothetical protein G5I_10079 [Acromyrmex echinatior]
MVNEPLGSRQCSPRVNLLSRAVRKLLKSALITLVRGSIRVRSCGQIVTGVIRRAPLRLPFRRSPRTTDLVELPTGTYPISWGQLTCVSLGNADEPPMSGGVGGIVLQGHPQSRRHN